MRFKHQMSKSVLLDGKHKEIKTFQYTSYIFPSDLIPLENLWLFKPRPLKEELWNQAAPKVSVAH